MQRVFELRQSSSVISFPSGRNQLRSLTLSSPDLPAPEKTFAVAEKDAARRTWMLHFLVGGYVLETCRHIKKCVCDAEHIISTRCEEHDIR